MVDIELVPIKNSVIGFFQYFFIQMLFDLMTRDWKTVLLDSIHLNKLNCNYDVLSEV